jgi:restriction system protein
MSVWLVRAGSHGEYEQKFLKDARFYLTWDKLNIDLKKLSDRDALFTKMTEFYPDAKPKRLQNWVSQVWPFAHDIEKGNLVVLPMKSQPSIYVGEVTDAYHFEPKGPDPFFHWLSVKWVGEAIPRTHFSQDLLYSFGAFMTVCRIQRNNADARLEAMRNNGWKAEKTTAAIRDIPPSGNDVDEDTDLEDSGRDQIAKLIASRFKGHNLTRLVESILKAQGYTTYRSPEGADGGVDILAGSGPLGFGSPRLCVEVKSEDAPIDRPTVDKLLGAITKFGAQEGLFVAWGGFRSNVAKELAQSFFRLRLWTQKELLEQLFTHYDQLDEDLKAELPLKRIWTVAAQEDE